ncbi:hypothetical protein SAMN06265379_1066 [Saccharicrinis carchari]|uniref:Uncharacterized protein n=1 Tax=Saccharicrinis carchari TaxID=1168039 RepID=A0A521DMC0_SACCC|nr:hypothetical protein [Saccharicrinis carchari]SMO72742.1 hypothetical protein SAMN06265379_1066 [Saccharicrinis carchari]
MKTKIQNKKIYSKPLLEVIDVDFQISMVMDSDFPGGPGDNPPAAQRTPQQGPAQLSNTSADNDPFGGSTPQY